MAFVLLVLFYLLFPVLVIYLASRYPIVNKIGPVVICYAAGLLIGNINILPEGIDPIQTTITMISISVAIPLILFSLDVRSWLKMAPKTFLSLLLGLISVLIPIFLGFYIFHDKIDESWKVAGMLVGVYSGATLNLASINLALHVDPDIFILTLTYDTVAGAVLLLFLITLAQKFFLLFMRPYTSMDKDKMKTDSDAFTKEFDSYEGIFTRKIFLPLLKGYGLAILIFACGGAMLLLVPKSVQETLIILTITTLGILASLVPTIHRIKKTFHLGMYHILVFCVVAASMADISAFNLSSLPILYFVIMAMWGSLLVHGILSRFFNIDVDNFLIVGTGLAMSPPFVPLVAGALKNREIIIPGLVVGIIGYAIGNYMGITIAYLLK